MDVRSLMRQATGHFASRPAVIQDSQVLTFEQAWLRGVKLANGLRELGVKPGDRVAGLEDNTLDAVDLFLACAIAGAVRVPLYARNAREGHAHMLSSTECSVLLVDEAYREAVDDLEAELSGSRQILTRNHDFHVWRDGQDETDPDVPIDGDDWFIVRHSGGTTGKPKGVAYSHHDWIVCCRNWFYPLPRLGPDSAVAHVGAISHASGYMFLPAWLHGARNVLLKAFDPDHVLDVMQAERVSHMFLAPTMLQALTRIPRAATGDWSKLQALFIGSAPITDATALAGHAVFGDVMYQAYGQTEALLLSILTPQDWFGEVEGSTPMRSAGRVLPFVQIQIWNEDDEQVPCGTEGEIVAKVEAQMRGYWKDEEQTRQRLVSGWVRTGDIGYLDANGFLYICDRADDLIISGGFNIWPAELETVIADHPDVIEVAVFGVPHAKWGETPLARCVVAEGAAVTTDEIVAFCATRLGSYKRPSHVELVTEPLPRSPVGKVQRKLMREPYWHGHDRRVAGA